MDIGETVWIRRPLGGLEWRMDVICCVGECFLKCGGREDLNSGIPIEDVWYCSRHQL